ncbi:MAG: 4-hydroxy-tetrahydrodipicolinate reductase [Halobacteriaceae archaeon]
MSGDSPAGGLSVAVTGATGRMGRRVVADALERGHAVDVAVNRSADGATVEGVSVEDAGALPTLLAERDPDVLVDFTGPSSALEYVDAAADAGVPVVTGTTGFDDAGETALEAAAAEVPLLRAANFSRGVAALERALRAAVAALPGYDVEVTETHHNQKTDAPSGTAKALLDALDDERGRAAGRVHGREGTTPRQPGEVGVHARRAGDVTGEHEVLLAGNDEVLELTHRTGDRGVFAAGALDAAEWLAGRDPGYYDFGAVIGER